MFNRHFHFRSVIIVMMNIMKQTIKTWLNSSLAKTQTIQKIAKIKITLKIKKLKSLKN